MSKRHYMGPPCLYFFIVALMILGIRVLCFTGNNVAPSGLKPKLKRRIHDNAVYTMYVLIDVDISDAPDGASPQAAVM